MNKLKPMLPILICLGVLVVLFIAGSIIRSCTVPEEPTEPSATDETGSTDLPIDPQALYSAAKAPLLKAPNRVLNYDFSLDRTVGGDTFTESRKGTASYIHPGMPSMQALISESLTYGGYSTQYHESYLSGQSYCRVNNYSYTSEMNAVEFLALQIPAAALDEALYGSITFDETANGMVIGFSEPSALESWVTDNAHAKLTSAWGTATLDENDRLVSITYHAEYTVSAAAYTLDVTVGISTPDTLDLSASQPVYPDDCATLSDLRIPRYLIRVVGDLYTAKSASASYTDSLYSEVHSQIRSQSGRFDLYGSSKDFLASLNTEVSVTEYSGTNTVNSQTATFRDGIYSYSYNGADPITDDSITPEQARQNWEDHILAALLTLDTISSATVSDDGDFLYICITGTDDYANNLSSACCTRLGLMDLDAYADTYSTEAIGGYLTINKHTLLPTAMGIYFERTHVIGGVPYALTYQLDQAVEIPGTNAYFNITGEVLQETGITEGATPLFYQVTTADGKTMWLFGTVSVGDGRTAKLPAFIMDAFNASAALAVEYDPEAFNQALQTDSTLIEKLTAAYYYSDNSKTESHLPKELYDVARPLLLATGTNSVNAPYMKVIIWENLIESLYLQQSYHLSTAQSMDQRLLDWAKAQEKPIREIETYMDVLSILSGYSDSLQATLIQELLRDGLITYNADTLHLYESWCAGNEEALLGAIATDTTSFTEEQMALYNEYRTATRTNRLKTMLAAAKDYINGEETVFYAVNIEYLLGEDGLIAQLTDAGYTVEQVKE